MQIFLIEERHSVHEPQIVLQREANRRPMSATQNGAAFRNRGHELLLDIEQALRVIISVAAERICGGGALVLQPLIERTRLLHHAA